MQINNSIKDQEILTFEEKGYLLVKNFFKDEQCNLASDWLKAQNHSKLAKSWTEQEPAVDLAVYSVIHEGNTPITKIATNQSMLDYASKLIGSETYIWASKVNLKAAWCGTAEYYHQDLVYWKDRGYPKNEMLSAMIFLEPHNINNAALHVIPGTHKLGFVEHEPFININGLSKFMIPPKTLTRLESEHGLNVIEAEVGDVLFFHTSLIHGSSHNISPKSRMIILSQLNTVGNEPREVSVNARSFNLLRAEREMKEAERKFNWFKSKYEKQLNSEKLTFSAPIPKEEKTDF
jgi:ectoine hydroxylase|tara:strand:+ start:1254 stop:2126 length:873 start_codon:yes stop_codon:yes gene_type:complete